MKTVQITISILKTLDEYSHLTDKYLYGNGGIIIYIYIHKNLVLPSKFMSP